MQRKIRFKKVAMPEFCDFRGYFAPKAHVYKPLIFTKIVKIWRDCIKPISWQE
jgi:hypothetical protein